MQNRVVMHAAMLLVNVVLLPLPLHEPSASTAMSLCRPVEPPQIATLDSTAAKWLT